MAGEQSAGRWKELAAEGVTALGLLAGALALLGGLALILMGGIPELIEFVSGVGAGEYTNYELVTNGAAGILLGMGCLWLVMMFVWLTEG